jgi:hypothetical protein
MILNPESYISFLTSYIKPFAIPVAGRKEVNCRCFYCADSSNIRKGHFYISVPKEDEPSMFYCQKCHAHGIVTAEKFIEWGIFHSEMGIKMTQYNSKVLSLAKNKKFADGVIYNVKNNHITDDKLSRFKLKYINDRLGINLSMKDCIRNKIVLNINDLIRENRLELTRHPNIVEQLDSNFLGFLSFDNAFINMRNLGLREVYESIDRRYINYNVFDKYDNTLKFYVPPAQIDMFDPSPVRIHLAEGPFDILSIKYNLVGENGRDIFISVGGSSYKAAIRHFLTNLGLYNLEVHIYMDNDQKRYVINDIVSLLYAFDREVYIHNNAYPNEKDYGVPKERIRDNIIKA